MDLINLFFIIFEGKHNTSHVRTAYSYQYLCYLFAYQGVRTYFWGYCHSKGTLNMHKSLLEQFIKYRVNDYVSSSNCRASNWRTVEGRRQSWLMLRHSPTICLLVLVTISTIPRQDRWSPGYVTNTRPSEYKGSALLIAS